MIDIYEIHLVVIKIIVSISRVKILSGQCQFLIANL